MEQILLAYGLPKETVMMPYKKAMVCPFDGDTDYFHIIAGVLLRDKLASYLVVIC